jgi:ABC-type polysaccharide/polyol phosphate transport system ATPase subunit
MAYLELCNVGLDLPIYDIQGRSLKKRLMRLGRRNELAEKSSGVIVVNALAGINLRLDSGDRVGLIGHNGQIYSVAAFGRHLRTYLRLH